MTTQPHEDERVTRARELTAGGDAAIDGYDVLVDTDPLELRNTAIELHTALADLLAYVAEERS